jgi:hypothetical protein
MAYSSKAVMRVVLAVLAVKVLANPSAATTMPPPAPFALAGDGQVVPPSGETSRYNVKLPLAPPLANPLRRKSPPNHPLAVFERVDPVT